MHLHVFEQFIELINDHHADELGSFMTVDHILIDAHGNKITGKENVIDGWKMYFAMFPDYWIEINERLEKDNIVFGFGTASATHAGHIAGDSNNFFKIPAAFRAIIEGEKINVWQVYSDTKIPFEIIERNKAK
ncbi:MAG: nuclear transport factor 2 family protein [Fimbriimonadaceae bacterium]|nr:nuclear transport factor 2 family protein [Chitinophagales bacterium]